MSIMLISKSIINLLGMVYTIGPDFRFLFYKILVFNILCKIAVYTQTVKMKSVIP